MIKQLIALTLSKGLVLSVVLLCNVHTYGEPFRFGLTPNIAAAEIGIPKPKAIGQLSLSNHIKILAFQVFYTAGWSDRDFETTAPIDLSVSYSLKPAIAKRVVAYYFDRRWLLVPNDWQLQTAEVGANGTRRIVFVPPCQQKGYMSYYDSGSCIGCGLRIASVFFKYADVINQRDFDTPAAYMDSIPKITAIQIRPHVKAYHTVIGQQAIDGLIYFDEQLSPVGKAPVEQVEVSLPALQADLATPLLNLWLSPRKHESRWR